jgi:hypothetical protein
MITNICLFGDIMYGNFEKRYWCFRGMCHVSFIPEIGGSAFPLNTVSCLLDDMASHLRGFILQYSVNLFRALNCTIHKPCDMM